MKKLLVIVLVIATIGGAVTFYLYNKPHRDVASEEAAHTLTADALFDAFDADEVGANALYLDKVVEVTGEVAEVTENGAGQAVITLTAANAMMGGVSATMQQPGKVSVIPGQTATVKCRCTGYLMDVILINCTVEP